MSRFCSPLRYPGGKNCIYKFVSEFFDENRMIGINYAEPYAGGAGLALRLLFNEYVGKIYINDLDPAIFAFWDAVLNHPREFCEWIEDVDVTVSNWHKYKEIHGQRGECEDWLELGKATFFLNRTNVSGVLKGGVIGGTKQTGKYKIDARFNKNELIERINRISRFRHRIVLSNQDGIKFIRKMNRLRDDAFIYLDPPYYNKGGELYMNFYSKNDHQKLAKAVSKIHKKWMVSYDNHEFIINLYNDHQMVLYQLSQCASNRVGDEVLIFDEELRINQSISALKSPTIRSGVGL